MRVIAGKYKGTPLLSPIGGDTVRPTTDRVKEALFSIVNFDLQDAVVADLFAGSGQLGIEALSRGAKFVHFIDTNISSVNLIAENLKKCSCENFAKIYKADCKSFLMGFSGEIDVAFLDPPYSLGIFNDAVKSTSGKMSKHGVIVVEHPLECVMEDIEHFKKKDYKYGKIMLTVYRKEESV